MGWRGYQSTIDVGMVFKKMYCCECGTRLKKKKVTNIYVKGQPGYTRHFASFTAIGMSELSMTTYIYRCPNCGLEINYSNQCLVAKKQKKLKKKVLDENEIGSELLAKITHDEHDIQK